jgi:Xaa-Pro dipeptidase
MPTSSTDNMLKLKSLCTSHPIFLSDPDSLYYFAGFTTPGASFSALIIEPHEGVKFVVRDLEATNLKRDEFSVYTYDETDGSELITTILRSYSTVLVELQSRRLSISLYEQLKTAHELVDISVPLRLFRSVKSSSEIENIKNACGYVQRAYENALKLLTSGMKETEFAGLLSMEKMKAGSEWTAYPEFVACGKSGCIGHKPASRDVIGENKVLFMEVGASHNRYHAAKMHTVFVDGTPPVWYVSLEAAIRAAVSVGTKLCRPGTNGKELDAAMRRIIEPCLDLVKDAPKFSMHRRSAYSIGIGTSVDWTDPSFLSNPTSNDALSENMVLHIIPWVHVVGLGAMGFSDIVHVKSSCGVSLFGN